MAGHTFAVSGEAEIFGQMENYESFRCEGGEPLFALTVESGTVHEYTEVYRQEEDGAPIICGCIAECLHQTENRLASTIPMWHLECLPNEEAVRLCHDRELVPLTLENYWLVPVA